MLPTPTQAYLSDQFDPILNTPTGTEHIAPAPRAAADMASSPPALIKTADLPADEAAASAPPAERASKLMKICIGILLGACAALGMVAWLK